MSLFGKLFGRSAAAPAPEPETHKGFSITATPQKTEGGYRIAAVIEKEVDGEAKRHQMIRADVIGSQEEAATASLRKARQMIDEQGEALF
ncbi:MAG: hypothetical protein JXQ91_18300 [Vannielia sp.]|uniref:HlyU family transcriptional regulator n=1 Tax=Vannielia sp. TaxID=2813045 RepID=UPI003B8D89E0